MVGSGAYTAEQLAFKAGVPLRTVRFYVQEKLIDAPLGRGRGSHFNDHHLVQLQQARVLQNAGFSLDQIRERGEDLSVGLQAMRGFEAMRQAWIAHGRAQESPAGGDDEEAFDLEDAVRIPMADGVDLLVDADRRLPSPKQLVELAFQVRRIFGER
jgi:DNA-binding transcriptional MerR regulator